MIPLADYDIRYTEMEDYPFLKQWFAQPDSCRDFPFDEPEMEDALKNWIGFFKFRASLTATLQNTPCAIGTLFLMPYRKVAHHCSFYLVVDPNHRRKGIGTSMVRNLLHLAQTYFRLESVHVEVFEPCPLQSILEKGSFHQFVRQENYIKTNGCPRARLLYEHTF